MATGQWYFGSQSYQRTELVYTTFYQDTTATITTPNTYTITGIYTYATAAVTHKVYVSCELYVGSTLIAKTTESLITLTTMTQYGFTRTYHNAGGPWEITITGATPLTFRIKFRNTDSSPRNVTFWAYYDTFSGIYRPYGIVEWSTPGSGMKVWTGSSWVKRSVKVWNGSSWVRRPVKVWNGSSWVTR